MCDQPAKPGRSVELADIFIKYADAYVEQHGVSTPQHKAITAVSRCRTATLGGHVSCCNHCGMQEISYNSCRHRHCPKCQTTKQMRWLESRKAEILPVPYFHVVFTLPHELNPLASYNQSVIYNLLFKAAWATIGTLGKDTKRLNGLMGMLAFLHTWGQNLSQHIHLHCMIPGGALCDEEGQPAWRSSKPDFLFDTRVLSKLFGKLFLTYLRQAFKNQEFTFKGSIHDLSKPWIFGKLQAKLSTKSWNVYAKEPFKGAEGGLEYLARYFSKTAIGNERIISCDDHLVAFEWCDYKDNSKSKVMKLDAHEFIRRYLTHVLPDGFMRVRSFGFLANACKAKNIATIRSLLATNEQRDITKPQPIADVIGETISTVRSEVASRCIDTKESVAALVKRVIGVDIELCKHCKIGRLEKTQILPAAINRSPVPWDTS